MCRSDHVAAAALTSGRTPDSKLRGEAGVSERRAQAVEPKAASTPPTAPPINGIEAM